MMTAPEFYNAMVDGGTIDIPIDDVEDRILRPGIEAGHAYHGYDEAAQEVGEKLIAAWRAGVAKFKNGEDNVWTPFGLLKRDLWVAGEAR